MKEKSRKIGPISGVHSYKNWGLSSCIIKEDE